MSDQKPKEVKAFKFGAKGFTDDAGFSWRIVPVGTRQVSDAEIEFTMEKLSTRCSLPSAASSLPPEVKLPELAKIWLESGGEESYHITALEGGLTEPQAAEVIRRCTDYAALRAFVERPVEGVEFKFIKLPVSLEVDGANNEVIRDAKGEALATFLNIGHKPEDTEAADQELDRFRQGIVDAFNARVQPYLETRQRESREGNARLKDFSVDDLGPADICHTGQSNALQSQIRSQGALRGALERASKVAHLMEGMHFENGDVMSPEAQLSVASALAAEIDAALSAAPKSPVCQYCDDEGTFPAERMSASGDYWERFIETCDCAAGRALKAAAPKSNMEGE